MLDFRGFVVILTLTKPAVGGLLTHCASMLLVKPNREKYCSSGEDERRSEQGNPKQSRFTCHCHSSVREEYSDSKHDEHAESYKNIAIHARHSKELFTVILA